MDCLFCKMVAGDIPVNKVYEDDRVLAFYDIAPQAPVHVLFIPKRHIASVAELDQVDEALAGHLLTVIAQVAKTLPLEGGYRVISNCGKDAAQSIAHLHFHLIGGKKMAETMV